MDMFRFLLKTMLLISILFIGVIIGFQEANHGLKEMKGFDDGTFSSVISVQEAEDYGEYEATILGEKVTSHDLEEKKKALEELNTYNLFTDIAKTFTDFLQKMISSLFS
jgi:hypothetical protein